MSIYLSTEDAAAYLGIKERKLYELAANGAVPCSKVTGKWLFPRAALDRWVESGLARPEGFEASNPPPIIGGSHDPLLEWAARRSGSGMAMLSVGSEAGLAKLAAGEIAIAAIHIHAIPSETDEDANLRAVEAKHQLHDAVVVAFAQREQGLLLQSGNPNGIVSLNQAVRSGLRFGRRQPGAGAELLLLRLVEQANISAADIQSAPDPIATGDDLAFAIRSGDIDCGIATRAVAAAKGLVFLPLAWERFDLVLRRRSYFEPGPQRLLNQIRTAEFRRHAESLGGYDTSDAGSVRLNR